MTCLLILGLQQLSLEAQLSHHTLEKNVVCHSLPGTLAEGRVRDEGTAGFLL